MGKPKILVAGFGPFPGAPKNPSGQLAIALANSRRIAATGAMVIGAVIPTTYQDVSAKFTNLLKIEKPDAVLMFGLAGAAPWIRVETRAANFASSVFPDAGGGKNADGLLSPGAPQILKARAPIRQLLAAARKAGVKASLSVNAGGYICNAAFFYCLEAAGKTGTPKLVAFVHIPWPRGRNRRRAGKQTVAPGFERLQSAAEAILLALIAAARNS